MGGTGFLIRYAKGALVAVTLAVLFSLVLHFALFMPALGGGSLWFP